VLIHTDVYFKITSVFYFNKEDRNLETSLWTLKRFIPVQVVVFSDSFLLCKVSISGSTGAVLIGHRRQDEQTSVCSSPSGTLTVINLPCDIQHRLQLLQVGTRTDRILLTI
jgi:hypothetical protein